MIDTHVHTEFSADSSAPVRSQIEQAIRLGMPKICITDHHDPDTPFTELDFTLDLKSYFPAMEALRKEYQGQIEILIGIELGIQRHIADLLETLSRSWPFDYIIGSSHFIDGKDPYDASFYEGRTEEEVFRRYFQVTLERIKAIPNFDSLGHLDYILRYAPNQNRFYSYDRYRDVIDPILETLIVQGRALECNTGGYQYGLGTPNPSADVLRRYRKMGGELITIGSDAHDPKNLGYAFAQARSLLKECGFRYYTVYKDRKPCFYPL